MRWLMAWTLVALLGAAGTARGEAAVADGFAGTWSTTYGPMTLVAAGTRMSGTYVFESTVGRVEGSVTGRKLMFRYTEGAVHGEGWFELAADGRSFSGQWREDGDKPWLAWTGTRGEEAAPATFEGLWESSFGRIRLLVSGDTVKGIYNYGDAAALEGKISGRRLSFRYSEPEARGQGWFELAPDGRTFRGEWKADGAGGTGKEWTGQRVVAEPGRTWLVVLEAYWEQSLAEPPYAFGEMLEAYFRRVPSVSVRRRSFSDEDDLVRWGRELAFLAEPVVVVIATHADERGLTVRGRTIGPAAIAEALRYGRTIELVHFSACAIMKGGVGRDLQKAVAPARFPVSGYTTSVDWGESAVTEMMYFELVLARGMNPLKASEVLVKMLPVAGDEKVAGAPWVPAGFRLLR